MSRILQLSTATPINYDFDHNAYLKTGNTLLNRRWDAPNLYIDTVSASNQSPSRGSTIDIHYQPTFSGPRRLDQLFLRLGVVNAHASSTATIWNFFYFLETVKFSINNVEIYEMNSEQLLLAVSRYYLAKGKNAEELFESLLWTRPNDTSVHGTMSGTTIAAASTTMCRFSLFPIVDFLENWTFQSANANIDKISFTLTFRTAENNVTEARYIKNNSADASIYQQLSFSNVQLEVWTRDLYDARLNVSYPNWIPVRHFSINRYTGLDFSSTSNSQLVKLSDFPAQAGIRKLWLFCIDVGAVTAYNDADACKFLGRHGDLNFSIKRVGDSKVTNITSAELMRQYTQDTYRMEYGHALPPELLLESGLADTYHGLFTCCIDFVGIDCEEGHTVMGGTDTTVSTNAYEITVYPTTAMSANVTLVGAVERIRPWTIDAKSHLPMEIKQY